MKYESMITTEERLLYLLLQEAQKLNEGINTLLAAQQPVRAIAKHAEAESGGGKQIPCKHCGGTHKNKGQVLACARKKKKEGA